MRPMPWMCPRCGHRNPLFRRRCRRCRVKCGFDRRLLIARVLAPGLDVVRAFPVRPARPRGA